MSVPFYMWQVLDTMRLLERSYKMCFRTVFPGIKKWVYLSIRFHSLLIRVAPQALTSSVLLYMCICVTVQRISMGVSCSSVRGVQGTTSLHLMKVFKTYKGLAATCKNWGWEDLESCTRHVLYMSLWWLQEPSPRKGLHRDESQSSYNQRFKLRMDFLSLESLYLLG